MFYLKCNKCNWFLKTKGIKKELEGLVEVKSCSSCGKPRVFQCPNCSNLCKMFRVQSQ